MSPPPSSVWVAPTFISRPHVLTPPTPHFLPDSPSRNHLPQKHWAGESGCSRRFQVAPHLHVLGSCRKPDHSQQTLRHSALTQVGSWSSHTWVSVGANISHLLESQPTSHPKSHSEASQTMFSYTLFPECWCLLHNLLRETALNICKS